MLLTTTVLVSEAAEIHVGLPQDGAIDVLERRLFRARLLPEIAICFFINPIPQLVGREVGEHVAVFPSSLSLVSYQRKDREKSVITPKFFQIVCNARR